MYWTSEIVCIPKTQTGGGTWLILSSGSVSQTGLSLICQNTELTCYGFTCVFDLLGSTVLLSVSFHSMYVVIICLLIHSSSLPHLFDQSLVKSLTVQYCMAGLEQRAAAASKMVLVRFSFSHMDLYFQMLMMALTLNASQTRLNQNHTQSKEVWTFCEVTNYLSLALSLFFHRFVPHHWIKYIWDLD